MNKVYILRDWNEYARLAVFSSYKKMIKYIQVFYDDPLEPKVYIDLKTGNIYESKEDMLAYNDPIAHFDKHIVR